MTFMMYKMPNVRYNSVESKNLMVRVGAIKPLIDRYELYYDYEIREGERPDTVAYDYYGNSSYSWLVMIPNDIYDVNYDWPLTTTEFHSYLMKKYGNVYELQSQPSYYKYVGLPSESPEEVARITLKMCPFTWNNLPDVDKSKWRMVSVYENEDNINESKRKIKLLSNVFLSDIDREITDLLNG